MEAYQEKLDQFREQYLEQRSKRLAELVSEYRAREGHETRKKRDQNTPSKSR